MQKDDPSPFANFEDAAEAIVSEFIGENVGSNEDEVRLELLPEVLEALTRDGELPNEYEVLALNGGVPEDGSWPESDDVADYGCPEEVRLKFPNTDAVIAGQF